jgi:hypothetical protein
MRHEGFTFVTVKGISDASACEVHQLALAPLVRPAAPSITALSKLREEDGVGHQAESPLLVDGFGLSRANARRHRELIQCGYGATPVLSVTPR